MRRLWSSYDTEFAVTIPLPLLADILQYMFPNEYNPEDDDSSEHEGDDARPAVFVTTREAVPLVVSQLDDPRAPESSALASYINDRLVARSAMPAEAIQRLLGLKLFESPVSLGLFAYEESPGLQCRLFGAADGADHLFEKRQANQRRGPTHRAF